MQPKVTGLGTQLQKDAVLGLRGECCSLELVRVLCPVAHLPGSLVTWKSLPHLLPSLIAYCLEISFPPLLVSK